MAEAHLDLSRSIDDFFTRCGLPLDTRNDCHQFIEQRFPRMSIEPAPTQGYCSYTVQMGALIIQFRPSSYRLDVDITAAAKVVYGLYAPTTTFVDTLRPSGLLVYEMEKIQGISYRDFRTMDHPQASVARLTLCEDFATFVAQSWHKRDQTQLPAGVIGCSIRYRLQQLSKELPLRFRYVAKNILSQMHLIDALPTVLTHGDILPSNIMVDPATGHLRGLVDWAEAEVLPFGMCLHGLEEILGCMADQRFIYHAHSDLARGAFWAKLRREIPELVQEATFQSVMLALDLGILLFYGFAFDNGAINRVVQEGKDVQQICYLDALLGHR